MPLFEFECRSCRTTFEELVRSTNAEEGVHCPSCGGQEVRKKVSTFSGRMGQGKRASDGAACPNGGCCSGMCGLN